MAVGLVACHHVLRNGWEGPCGTSSIDKQRTTFSIGFTAFSHSTLAVPLTQRDTTSALAQQRAKPVAPASMHVPNRAKVVRETIHCPLPKKKRTPLSVGLLVPGAGTWTAELLGLHAAVVRDEESAVVGDEGLLELVLAVLVDVLLVVCDLF